MTYSPHYAKFFSMKLFIFLTALLLTLTSCSSQREAKFNFDLSEETWMSQVQTAPIGWTRNADAWFLSGDAHIVEMPPYATPINATRINAGFFNNIVSTGDFRVQIYSSPAANSIYIYGPAAGVRDTLITTKGHTLYLTQRPKASPTIRNVIIRIGVNQLNRLVQQGRGVVEGMRLDSSCLSVTSTAGSIYLDGHLNVTSIRNYGFGQISIFGANTPRLDIATMNRGAVNVIGNIGVRTIVHHGCNNINIIGANSDGLRILADGTGTIGINGTVNLCEVNAKGSMRIFVLKTLGARLHVRVDENVCIGLAGAVHNFYVDAYHRAFVAASRLCSDNAYVNAHDSAHVNVSASQEMFATADGSSSVYFYGPPSVLSRFTSDSGFVMQMCSGKSFCAAAVALPPPVLPPLMLKGAG